MKTILKNKALTLIVLTISTLSFIQCSNKTKMVSRDLHQNIIESFGFDDHYDTLMHQNIQKEPGVRVMPTVQRINHSKSIAEEKYSAILCECYAVLDNILELTLKTNARDCSGDPVGYQQFRLSRFMEETKDGQIKNFFTFAAILKEFKKDTIETRIQNFYITEGYEGSEFPTSIRFVKRYNYDLFNREQTSKVNLDFYFEKMPDSKTLCLTKIVNHDFNMIGGSKPLVFDIVKSFDTKGIALLRQDSLGSKLAQR